MLDDDADPRGSVQLILMVILRRKPIDASTSAHAAQHTHTYTSVNELSRSHTSIWRERDTSSNNKHESKLARTHARKHTRGEGAPCCRGREGGSRAGPSSQAGYPADGQGNNKKEKVTSAYVQCKRE